MAIPNFIIIGAAKAGTTSLYHYLNQHPDIFMSPEKEPRYFEVKGDKLGNYQYTELEQYEKLFRGVRNEAAIGEATTFYLSGKVAPKNIKEKIPEAKLIAVLRNPVDRAYSHFGYWRRDGKEREGDFSKVVERELERLNNGRSSVYLGRGMYGEQLKRYYDVFPKEQIRVYLFEELRDRPQEMLKDIFRYLCVDDSVQLDLKKHFNITTIPEEGIKKALYSSITGQKRIKTVLRKLLPDSVYWYVVVPTIRRLKDSIRSGKRVEATALSSVIRNQLISFYSRDIMLTEKLIGRDLSEWRKVTNGYEDKA